MLQNYKKISLWFSALMMAGLVFAGSATPVQAQSLADLEAQIARLQAILTQLLAGAGGTTVSTGYTYHTNLTIGSRGTDVVQLQQFLVGKGFLTMPAGVAYGYFGPLTQSALARYQASVGIAPAVGYFGPITRGHMNAMGTVVVPPPASDDDDDDDDLAGGTGSISSISETSRDVDDEVLEGRSDVQVLGFEIEAEGSDLAISSVRVEFEHTGNGSDRLDRYIDEVAIIMDGDVVGMADVDDFNESNDIYSETIVLDDAVVREDEENTFYVAVSALSNIDSDDLNEDWTVELDQLRYEDASGAILIESVSGIEETFTFEDLATSGNLELTVGQGDDDINDARVVRVSDSSDTNDVEILSFTLEADGSDIYLDRISFTVDSDGAGVSEIANTFRLEMEGDEVGDDVSFSAGSATSRTVTIENLDDDDVVIDEGDEVSFVLLADINELDGNFTAGDSLSVQLSADDIEAEDENGDDVPTGDLRGSAESNDISFASTGIMINSGASDSSSVLTNTSNDSTDDQGRYIINFDVTAFEDTAYVALTAIPSTSSNPASAGAYVYIEDTGNTPVGSGVTYATLERISGGSTSGNFVRINAGQTASLRLTVYYDPATTDVYRAQLHAINFNDTQASGDSQQLAIPETSFQSPSEQVLN